MAFLPSLALFPPTHPCSHNLAGRPKTCPHCTDLVAPRPFPHSPDPVQSYTDARSAQASGTSRRCQSAVALRATIPLGTLWHAHEQAAGEGRKQRVPRMPPACLPAHDVAVEGPRRGPRPAQPGCCSNCCCCWAAGHAPVGMWACPLPRPPALCPHPWSLPFHPPSSLSAAAELLLLLATSVAGACWARAAACACAAAASASDSRLMRCGSEDDVLR